MDVAGPKRESSEADLLQQHSKEADEAPQAKAGSGASNPGYMGEVAYRFSGGRAGSSPGARVQEERSNTVGQAAGRILRKSNGDAPKIWRKAEAGKEQAAGADKDKDKGKDAGKEKKGGLGKAAGNVAETAEAAHGGAEGALKALSKVDVEKFESFHHLVEKLGTTFTLVKYGMLAAKVLDVIKAWREWHTKKKEAETKAAAGGAPAGGAAAGGQHAPAGGQQAAGGHAAAGHAPAGGAGAGAKGAEKGGEKKDEVEVLHAKLEAEVKTCMLLIGEMQSALTSLGLVKLGTVAGAAIGGPLGAVIGGVAGGAISAIVGFFTEKPLESFLTKLLAKIQNIPQSDTDPEADTKDATAALQSGAQKAGELKSAVDGAKAKVDAAPKAGTEAKDKQDWLNNPDHDMMENAYLRGA